ncbi:unnamed protein product [Prorocentrum cordatum]|uniref:Apple domain-containing protein n=1 Tax=Prorocentrum cordatum TaxID=2364126 RepID=A0ABN9T5W3_9DINO|nr:unnamed protein product [Polarella glacialis]
MPTLVLVHASRRRCASMIHDLARATMGGVRDRYRRFRVQSWPGSSPSPPSRRGQGLQQLERHPLLEFADVDLDTCEAKCNATASCYHYNYHPDACKHSADAPRTCFLFAKGCVLEEDPCWNLYESPTVPAWRLRGNATGCGNWARAGVGEVQTAMNRGHCGVKCSQHPQCRLFNFQPRDCHEDVAENVPPAGAGACWLYTSDPPCREGRNACWDLYEMSSEGSLGNSTWSLLPAARGTRRWILHTSDDASFSVADVVSIQFADTSQQTAVVMGKDRETPGWPSIPGSLRTCWGAS